MYCARCVTLSQRQNHSLSSSFPCIWENMRWDSTDFCNSLSSVRVMHHRVWSSLCARESTSAFKQKQLTSESLNFGTFQPEGVIIKVSQSSCLKALFWLRFTTHVINYFPWLQFMCFVTTFFRKSGVGSFIFRLQWQTSICLIKNIRSRAWRPPV